MSDNHPTTPGPQLRALNAMRALISAVRNTQAIARESETAIPRVVLDASLAFLNSTLDIADREEREARIALIGGSHFGADAR
jgi:hypothetical protein